MLVYEQDDRFCMVTDGMFFFVVIMHSGCLLPLSFVFLNFLLAVFLFLVEVHRRHSPIVYYCSGPF